MKILWRNFILLFLGVLVYACEDANPDWYGRDSFQVSASIGDSLRTHFPDAQYIEWDAKGNYFVAAFRSNGYEMDAWFTLSGVWCMTEKEVSYKLLPDLVKEQITEVSGHVENILKIERPHFCIQYLIDMTQSKMLCLESGQRILYAPDVADAFPIDIPEPVLSKLQRNYPDFKIALAEKINGIWELLIYTNYNLEHFSVTDLGVFIENGD